MLEYVACANWSRWAEPGGSIPGDLGRAGAMISPVFRRRNGGRAGSIDGPDDVPKLLAWLSATDMSMKAQVVLELVAALRAFGLVDGQTMPPARYDEL
jgi:hypothetical protein